MVTLDLHGEGRRGSSIFRLTFFSSLFSLFLLYLGFFGVSVISPLVLWMSLSVDSKNKELCKNQNKMAKDLNRHFCTEDIQPAIMHTQWCLTSVVIREMEIKITIRNHFIPTRMAIIRKWKITNVGEHMENPEPSFIHCWWKWIFAQPLWKIVWWFFTKLSLELHYDPAILILRGVCVCVCVCKRKFVNKCS